MLAFETAISETGRCTTRAVEKSGWHRAYRYLDILENPEQKVMRFYKRIEPRSILPRMTPSQQLDALISPTDR